MRRPLLSSPTLLHGYLHPEQQAHGANANNPAHDTRLHDYVPRLVVRELNDRHQRFHNHEDDDQSDDPTAH